MGADQVLQEPASSGLLGRLPGKGDLLRQPGPFGLFPSHHPEECCTGIGFGELPSQAQFLRPEPSLLSGADYSYQLLEGHRVDFVIAHALGIRLFEDGVLKIAPVVPGYADDLLVGSVLRHVHAHGMEVRQVVAGYFFLQPLLPQLVSVKGRSECVPSLQGDLSVQGSVGDF